MRKVWIETGALMAIALLIDLLLLACRIPFWAAALVTLGIFLGADAYHHAQGGHKDDDA